MRLRVDRQHCTGHGQCEVNGPDVYALDDLGYSEPLVEEIPDALLDQARAGEAACPERAITIES